MNEQTQEPRHVTKLESFLRSGIAHKVFIPRYDDDKEFYKQIIESLLKPTDEEKKEWIAKFFKNNNKEEINLDDIYSCHNCEGKFSGHSIKWKKKEEALCARYPLCPSNWSEFDIHWEGKAPKPKPKNKCSKHYPKKYKVSDGLPKNMCPGCMEAYAFVNNLSYDEVKEKCLEEEAKKYEVCYHCKQVDGENCTFCAIRRSSK
jgi:hypothetical protein